MKTEKVVIPVSNSIEDKPLMALLERHCLICTARNKRGENITVLYDDPLNLFWFGVNLVKLIS